MIVSFIKGRVRIRHVALKNAETMQTVVNMLTVQDGVRDIQANGRTGSLLVMYDPEVIPQAMLISAAEQLETDLDKAGMAAESAGAQGSWSKKRVCFCPLKLSYKSELALLAASALGTFGGAAFSKRLHIGAGAVFMLALGRHFYSRRRRFMNAMR